MNNGRVDINLPDQSMSTVMWLSCDLRSFRITNLGSGSDFTSFIQTAGVTSSSFTYATVSSFSAIGNMVIFLSYEKDSYAVYHSVHDNFYWMTNFGDPDFSHHAAMGEVWLKVAMAIATTPIIPYNPTDYSDKLKALYNELLKDYGDQLKKNNVSTGKIF